MGIRRLGGGGVDGDMASSPELFPPVSCPVGAAELGAKSAPAPHRLESQLCRWCQFLMSLIPSEPSVCSRSSLLIWSQPLRFCDRDNGSGRWEAATPFSSNVPGRRQGRHHLEGEGQIIKKNIY